MDRGRARRKQSADSRSSSTPLRLRSPAPLLQREAGKRLIFKRAAAFGMTQNFGAERRSSRAVRAALCCRRVRGGGVGGVGGQGRHRHLQQEAALPASASTEGSFITPSFLKPRFKPGTTACSMKAAGTHRTRSEPDLWPPPFQTIIRGIGFPLLAECPGLQPDWKSSSSIDKV